MERARILSVASVLHNDFLSAITSDAQGAVINLSTGNKHLPSNETFMATVLVVDDSRVSRMLSRQFILQKHPDWTIAEAASGEEAIEKLASLKPDLIMLDLNMPGMGGFNAVEIIQKMQPEAPITLLTANVQDTVRERAHALGIDFAEKPITQACIDGILAGMRDG